MDAKGVNAQIKLLEDKLKASEQRCFLLESQLNLSNQNYRYLFNNLGDEVHKWKLVRDENGEIVTWELVDANPAALKSWDKTKEEVIGKTTNEIFKYDATTQFMRRIQLAFKTNKPIKWVEYFEPTDQFLSMTTTPMGEYFVSMGNDITESKRKDRQLELLRQAIDNSLNGFFILNCERKIIYINKSFGRMFGYDRAEEIVGTSLDPHLVDPMVRNRMVDELRRNGESILEFKAKRKDGSQFDILMHARIAYDEVGNEIYPTSFIDITKRKEAEEALWESEQKFKALFQHASVAKVLADDDGNYQDANEKACDLLGYSYEELTSISESAVIKIEKDPICLNSKLKENDSKEEEEAGEIEVKRKDGEIRIVEYYIKRIGKNLNLTTLIDVTDKRKTERERKEAEQKIKEITNSVPGTIYQFRLNNDGTYAMPFISDRSQDLLGYTKEKLQDVDFLFSCIHPDDYEKTIHSIFKANYDDSYWTAEFRAINKSGHTVWIKGFSHGVQDDQRNIVHSGVLLDITAQKNIEYELGISQRRYLNIANNLPGIVLRYKIYPNGTDELLYISNGSSELFEVSPEEALSNNQLLWDRVHKDDLKEYAATIQASAKDLCLWKFRHRLQFPDGRVKWVDMRGVPSLQIDGSVIWDSIGLDITQQRIAELELEKLNRGLEKLVEERAKKAIELSKELELYWLAAEHSKSGVWRYDIINKSLAWDAIMYDLYGLDKNSFSGAYEAWESSLHPQDKERVVKELNEAIEKNNEFDSLFRVVRHTTGDISHIRAKGKLAYDDKGNPIEIYGTNWDVSREMKLADEREKALNTLKEAQTQLIQSEKMASLGVLTAGVAHELNNPLNYIVGGYTAILQDFESKEACNKKELKEYLSWIKTGADRAIGIVKSLSLFCRTDKEREEDCDLHQVIDDCLLMLHNKTKDRIEIVKKFTESSVSIRGNDGKLHQAILNLLANAIDAIDTEGKIIIETRLSNGFVHITIEDNGCGIEDKYLGVIADPFFTTKPPGKGTGLGLSIANSIIREHEGQLLFSSKVNEGSVFSIKVPKSKNV